MDVGRVKGASCLSSNCLSACACVRKGMKECASKCVQDKECVCVLRKRVRVLAVSVHTSSIPISRPDTTRDEKTASFRNYATTTTTTTTTAKKKKKKKTITRFVG